MDDEAFQLYLRYHFATCEREDIAGGQQPRGRYFFGYRERSLLPPPIRFLYCGGFCPHSPCMGAPPHAPGDFLMRRKSPKTHQEPPGLEFGELLTSGEGGGSKSVPLLTSAPFDPPALCPSGIGCGGLKPSSILGGVRNLPRHGLKTQSVLSMKPEEKTRPIYPPAQSGKSVYFCGRR